MNLIVASPYVVAVFYLASMYVVWRLGRAEYLDEEKLIDLVFVSSFVGILAAKIAYWILPFGQEGLRIAFTSSSWLLILTYLARLDLMITWVAFIFFYLTVLWLIRQWTWPYWPVLGIVSLGVCLFGGLVEAWFWIIYGGNEHLLLLLNAIIAAILCIYLLLMGGDRYLLYVTDYLEGKLKQLPNRQDKKTN